MSAKWKAPCNLCKGLSKLRCMFCGWKEAPRKKVSEMNNRELADLNGLRNRRQFMMDLDASSTRAGNCSTNLAQMDEFLKEHRQWCIGILHRVEKGHNIKDIADDEQMTSAFIRKVVRMTGDKLIRGHFEIGMRPDVKPNILPEFPPTQRKKIKWEEGE